MKNSTELDKNTSIDFFHKKTLKQVYTKIKDAAIHKNEWKYDKRFLAGFCSGILISSSCFAFLLYSKLEKEEVNILALGGVIAGALISGLSALLRACHPTACIKKNLEEKTLLAFRALSEENVRIFVKQACEELNISMTSEEIMEFSAFLYNYIQNPDNLDKLEYTKENELSPSEFSFLLKTP
jgi:hypothetical protein